MTAVQLLASAIVMLSVTSANARPAGSTFERLGVPITFDSLRGALLAPDVATRIPAAIALGRLGCGHNSFCVATLTSTYWDVRHGAAKALGNCPTDSALSALKALLRRGEPNLQVQIVAAKVLCEAGDTDAIVLLDSLAAATHDPYVRRYVCRSSARTRHPVSEVPRVYWDNYGPRWGFFEMMSSAHIWCDIAPSGFARSQTRRSTHSSAFSGRPSRSIELAAVPVTPATSY